MTDSPDAPRKRTGITHVMQSVPDEPNEAAEPVADGKRVMKRTVNDQGEIVTEWVLADDVTPRSGVTHVLHIPEDLDKR